MTRVLRAATWEPVAELLLSPTGHSGDPLLPRFTSDGRWLVGASGDMIRLARVGSWRVAPPVALRKQPDSTFRTSIRAVRVSRDGAWMAVQEVFFPLRPTRAGANPTKAPQWRLWSLVTGQEVTAGASHDQREALIGSAPGWPGYEAADVPRLRDGNTEWRVTTDGQVVRLWPLDRAAILEAGCQRLSRNLSLKEWTQHFGNEPYRPTCGNLKVPAS
jgi:hypothetical protein